MSDLRSLWIKTGRFLAFVTHFLTLGPYSNPRLLTVLPIVSVYSFHYKFLQVTLSCQGMQIFHSSQFSAFSFLRIKTGQSLPPGVRGQRWKPRLGWLPRKQLCWVWATARQPPPTPTPIHCQNILVQRGVLSSPGPPQPISIQERFFAWVLLHGDPDWQLRGLNSGPLCTVAPWSVELQTLYFLPLRLPCNSQSPSYSPCGTQAFSLRVSKRNQNQNTRPYNRAMEMVMMGGLEPGGQSPRPFRTTTLLLYH